MAEQHEPEVTLRPMTESHNVVEDYAHVGLTLREHPISFLRRDLTARRIVTCPDAMNARDKSFVCAAGLVLVRQKPGNAKGVMFINIVKNQRVRELSSFTETVEGSIRFKS